jgi:hypothetical protein
VAGHLENDARARAIVRAVLEAHELRLDEGEIDELGSDLYAAGEDEDLLVAADRVTREKQATRKAGIKALESAIALYEPYRRDQLSAVGKAANAVLPGMRALLKLEKSKLKNLPSRPNRRPPTAKNRSATFMWRRLHAHGVDLWKACAIIARMFVEAGLGSGDVVKEQRALYNKLERQSEK